jgi:hypothetical protein
MWHVIVVFLTALPLAWALIVWSRRRRFLRRLEASACALCGAAFDDAIAEYLGGVSGAELADLDRFQRRFARHRVACGDCGAINLCTPDGRAFIARAR